MVSWATQDDLQPVADPSRPRSATLADLPFAQLDDPPASRRTSNSMGSTARGTTYGKGKQAAVLTLDESDEEGNEALREQWDGESEEKVEGTVEEQEQLQQLEAELSGIDSQIQELRTLRASLATQRDTLVATIASRQSLPKAKTFSLSAAQPPPGAVDFSKGTYPWTDKAKKLAKEIWGVKSYRMAQEGGINSTMAGRDVLCVMPTGGGKSLIYQIPALLCPGTTIVITPLISLMTDQVQNLQSRGVAAEALHASTPSDVVKSVMKRMVGSAGAAKGKGKKKAVAEDEDEEEIKLVYVTPERIDKAKSFVNNLQKMYDAKKLGRFIIDEAHCVSTQGHDYRPSYLALQRLKVLFPNVPILAVTATAPANVITDMLKTLGMPRKTSPGDAAVPNTTVLFTAPLYRPNLRYTIVPKPSNAQKVIDDMVDYILDNHKGHTGIIYTLSRADSENVANGINAHARSKGKLVAAVYHAYIDDAEKLRVQERWKSGKIHVVVATNASFGLGIDHPSVRFVLHHSLAKSLEGQYQESGRAGRDGEVADCVTYWRAADASRLSGLTYETFHTGGKEKLYEVVRFAEDKKTCRKLLFHRYFSAAYDRAKAFDAQDGDTPCGHCDNCTRDPSTVSTVFITLAAYRALRIICTATSQRGTLTLPQAADLVRGLGGGSFSTQERKGKGEGKVDVSEVAGGKVALSKDETEQMLLKLLVEGYLQERFHATAYNVTSYLQPSSLALRLTRLPPSSVSSADELPVNLEMDVLVSSSAGGKKRKAVSTGVAGGGGGGSKAKKQKKRIVPSDDEDEDGTEQDNFRFDDDGMEEDGGEEDPDALEALRQLEPSSDGMMDVDGWAKVKTAGKPSKGGGGGGKQKETEVIELD
ncbi:hypothetical protein JCM8547_009085 [Rhodosporidiobolus lusitaniae]